MSGPYVGARAPETFALVIVDQGFVFTGINGEDIVVTLPRGGERRTWTWARDTSVAGQITLTHTFAADGSDVPRAGVYRFTGWLLTGGAKVKRIDPLEKEFFPYD